MSLKKNRYFRNYYLVYFWRFLSLSTGFLSLLIVIPQLSSNKELYGIYIFCLSFSLYLTYADIGFLSAGKKFAAEEYAKGERDLEIKYLGFTGFVLLCMIIPFSLIMIYFSLNPQYVVKNLSIDNSKIVSNLFLIIAIITPVQVILQRLSQSILIIRIKEYVSLRIDIIFNFIKIISVYYFFTESQYLVVEYFLFTNVLTIISSLIIIMYIKSSEKYNFGKLFKSIRYDKFCFIRIKKLAYASLLMTISWLIYYELDLLFIGKLFGSKEVATYAIGFTVLNFLRNIWNIVYSPFAQRFNHFVATDSFQELNKMTFKLLNYTFPLCVISVLVLLLSSEKLILAWVGIEYVSSISILQILLTGTLFNFILQPASYYFFSTANYFYLKLNAFVLPVVFLITSLVLVPNIGIRGFAIAKVLAILTSAIISFHGLRHIISLKYVFNEWYLSIVVNSFFIYFGLHFSFLLIFETIDKSKYDLILLFSIILFMLFLVALITLFMKRSLRCTLVGYFKSNLFR